MGCHALRLFADVRLLGSGTLHLYSKALIIFILWLISHVCYHWLLLPLNLFCLPFRSLAAYQYIHSIGFFASAFQLLCGASKLLYISLANQQTNYHSTSSYDLRFLNSQPFHYCWLLRAHFTNAKQTFFKKKSCFWSYFIAQICRKSVLITEILLDSHYGSTFLSCTIWDNRLTCFATLALTFQLSP